MRKSLNKLINIDFDPSGMSQAGFIQICDTHYDVISHLMICTFCKRKLPRNHIFYITQVSTFFIVRLYTVQFVTGQFFWYNFFLGQFFRETILFGTNCFRDIFFPEHFFPEKYFEKMIFFGTIFQFYQENSFRDSFSNIQFSSKRLRNSNFKIFPS